MVSNYLKRPLRSEQQARNDIWNAVQSWTSHLSKPKEEYPLYPCGHDVIEGETECSICREEAEWKAEREREIGRNYRGPCAGKEGW